MLKYKGDPTMEDFKPEFYEDDVKPLWICCFCCCR